MSRDYWYGVATPFVIGGGGFALLCLLVVIDARLFPRQFYMARLGPVFVAVGGAWGDGIRWKRKLLIRDSGNASVGNRRFRIGLIYGANGFWKVAATRSKR